MKRIQRTTQFKRDVSRAKRRNRNLKKLREVLHWLEEGVKLPASYRDHALVGQYKGTRECHLEPDWLLIYEASGEDVILIRTGSHSDLFR